MSATIPESLGNFRILSKIGQGGMGAVYQAVHGTLERPVALKILPAEFSSNPEYVMRFLREARTIATLRHENIVQVYDAGEENGQYYIAMELVDGDNLSKCIEKQPLSEAEGLSLLLQAAKGLSAAHAKNLVHRDIKPENLLLGKDSVLRIVDFGLVMESASTTQLTATGACLGTPMYMSPEQADGEQADARTDLYSLGVTFFRVFTGQPPFNSATVLNLLFKHKFEAVPHPKSVRADLSDDTANLLLHLLAKRREDRPPSAQALAGMIEGIKVGKHIPPPAPFTGVSGVTAAPTLVARTPGTAGKGKLGLGAAALAAVVAVAVVFAVRRTPDSASVPPAPADQTANEAPGRRFQERGDAAFAAGRFQEAIDQYGEALATEPQNTAHKQTLARARRALDFQEMLRRAEAAEAKGDLEDALGQYARAVPLDEGRQAADRVKALKDKLAALQKIPVQPAPAPHNAEREHCIKKAQEAEQSGQFEAAADAYSRAAGLSDGSLRVSFADKAQECRRQMYLSKALAAEKAQDFDGAAGFYAQAQTLRADPLVAEKMAALKRRQQELQDQRELDRAYDAAMRAGQAALQATDLRKARIQFGIAKGLKSDQRAPREKLGEAERCEAKLLTHATPGSEAAISKADALLRAEKDDGALAEIAAALRNDASNADLKNMKAAIEMLQGSGTIYTELAKIIDAAGKRFKEALAIDDEDRTKEMQETYQTLHNRFAEHSQKARPLMLERNFGGVKACLDIARKDAAQLSEELVLGASFFETRADKAGEKITIKDPFRIFKAGFGGDSKKAEKYRKIAEGFRKLSAQAKVFKD